MANKPIGNHGLGMFGNFLLFGYTLLYKFWNVTGLCYCGVLSGVCHLGISS